MVYGKIFYNNIKEYTPTWIKTIPYSQVTKTVLGRKPQVVSKFNADPKVKRAWRFLQTHVQKNTTLWQIFIFFNAYVLCTVVSVPWLAFYQSKNRTRTLDYAIEQERIFKKKQADEAESSE